MRPGDATNSNERGMSLLEVLIALVILAFVALGIASLFHHAQFTNASGYSYAVCLDSPVSPHYQAGEGGVTIGALDALCSGCISPVNVASWGAIKALYR